MFSGKERRKKIRLAQQNCHQNEKRLSNRSEETETIKNHKTNLVRAVD